MCRFYTCLERGNLSAGVKFAPSEPQATARVATRDYGLEAELVRQPSCVLQFEHQKARSALCFAYETAS